MNRWQRWLQSVLPQVHLYQVQSLALFSFAAACAQHCHLARLCAQAPSPAQPGSISRRLQRLLGNPRLDVSFICHQMASWLKRWNAPSCRLLLLMDETPWHNHWRVLKISLAWKRRALPLCWMVFPLSQREQPFPQSVRLLLEKAQDNQSQGPSQGRLLGELAAQRNQTWCGRAQVFKKAGWLECNVLAACRLGAKRRGCW